MLLNVGEQDHLKFNSESNVGHHHQESNPVQLMLDFIPYQVCNMWGIIKICNTIQYFIPYQIYALSMGKKKCKINFSGLSDLQLT